MTKILMIPFILFFLATGSSLANANEARNAQDHELSKHRHADQNIRKHGHKHDHRAVSKPDLKHKDSHDHGEAHHDHGDSHKDDHGDGHNPHGAGQSSHDEHSHEGHGEGHGGHEHGYDRLWDCGISG